MIYGLAIGLYVVAFLAFVAFTRFCEWVLSRREANS